MVTRSRSTLRQRLFASDRALARAVLWTFMIVFVAVATGLPDRRAGEIEFQTTSALARTGSLSFTAESSPEAAGLIALHQAGVPIFQRLMQPTSSGAYVASEEPGQALVALPFYWLGRLVAHFDPEREVRYAGHGFWRDSQSEYYAHLFVGLRNPLMGALTAWLITLIVLQLGLSRRWALLGGLSFGLTSFALAQARSTLSDVQAMCAIVAAVHMLLLLRSRVVIGARARVEHGLMMGALLALAVLTRFELVIACFVLWVVAGRILWRLDRKVFVALSLMASTGLIAIVWMNQARFGFAFGLDPSALAASVSAHPPHWSLLGFLVSPNKGLFFGHATLFFGGGELHRAGDLGARSVVGSLARRLDLWATIGVAGSAVPVRRRNRRRRAHLSPARLARGHCGALDAWLGDEPAVHVCGPHDRRRPHPAGRCGRMARLGRRRALGSHSMGLALRRAVLVLAHFAPPGGRRRRAVWVPRAVL
jgi:hypothetical protein